MASPDGNKALLSPPAEPSSRRSPPVADVWQGRRSGARRPCSIPVADSAPGEAPLRSPPGPCRRAVMRRGTAMRPLPRRTPVFSRATGVDRQPSCPAQRQGPFPAALPGSSVSRLFPGASSHVPSDASEHSGPLPKRKAPQSGEPDRGRLRRCLPALEGDMAGAAAVPWPYR